MKSIVTGCAGFIGSHLVERLLKDGHHVVGIDCFTANYDKSIKKKNMQNFINSENFHFIEQDINRLDLKDVLYGVDYVFHLAAQTGVRSSWGENFRFYVDNNILTTQNLLEAARESKIQKIICSSSSSVYGDVDRLPMKESDIPKPISPYGITKLAGEHLCDLYWKNFGVPAISLRYFTVYGPRQRPDMAIHKLVKDILGGNTVQIYGDGEQTRDFTYVEDIVAGTVMASQKGNPGEVYNIAGGSKTSVNGILRLLEELTGRNAVVEYIKKQNGDVGETFADISKAETVLGYFPKMNLTQGLRKFIAKYRETVGI